MSEERTLTITFEDFLSVLKAWESFIWIEVTEFPKNFDVYSCKDEFQGQYAGVNDAFTSDKKLSDIASALWSSLERGAGEVDKIHDETFVQVQVNFFTKLYDSIEKIEKTFYSEPYSRTKEPVIPPHEMFAKLSQPAQINLLQSGFFKIATDNYNTALEKVRHKNHLEAQEEDRKRREEFERFKQNAQEYVNSLPDKSTWNQEFLFSKTNDQLSAICFMLGVGKGGNKQELVTRITKWLSKQK